MSLEWAKAFAKVLETTVDEVLRKAGVTDNATAQQLRPGFSESEANPFIPANGREKDYINRCALAFGGEAPGVDIWRMKSKSMALNGVLDGDFILVDTHRAGQAVAGDVVVAQAYDMQSGSARTIVRRYQPPVLVAAGVNPEDLAVHVVDGNNVVIRGLVVATWRTARDTT